MTATTARRVDYEDCKDELLAMRARDAASFSTLLGGTRSMNNVCGECYEKPVSSRWVYFCSQRCAAYAGVRCYDVEYFWDPERGRWMDDGLPRT